MKMIVHYDDYYENFEVDLWKEGKGFVLHLDHEYDYGLDSEQREANFTVNPCPNAEKANINDHGRGVLNCLFKSSHPGIAGLDVVLVEPNSESAATQNFGKLVGRRRIHASMTHEDVAVMCHTVG